MKYTNQSWTPYMQSMRVPQTMFPIVDMNEEQLEEMYPSIYFVIMPVVSYQCDMLDAQYGDMYVPSKEEFNEMVEGAHSRVSDDLEAHKKQGIEITQWGRDSSGLRDLISIILLREMIGRRRYPRRYPWDDDYRRRPGYGRGPDYGRGPGYRY